MKNSLQFVSLILLMVFSCKTKQTSMFVLEQSGSKPIPTAEIYTPNPPDLSEIDYRRMDSLAMALVTYDSSYLKYLENTSLLLVKTHNSIFRGVSDSIRKVRFENFSKMVKQEMYYKDSCHTDTIPLGIMEKILEKYPSMPSMDVWENLDKQKKYYSELLETTHPMMKNLTFPERYYIYTKTIEIIDKNDTLREMYRGYNEVFLKEQQFVLDSL